MKKLLISLGLLAIISTTFSVMVFAADTPTGGTGSGTGGTSSTQSSGATTDQLFTRFTYTNASTDKTKIGAVNKLPDQPWQVVLASVVKTLLNISGGLALLALTLGGTYMITARGDTGTLDKGKKIVAYAIAGLVVIAVSYAVVVGVSELQFFTPGTAGGSGSTSSGAPATSAPAPAPDSGTAGGGGTL